MASACTAGQSGRFTEMHSACVTRAAAIASSSAGSSAASSGKSRWQCESTYIGWLAMAAPGARTGMRADIAARLAAAATRGRSTSCASGADRRQRLAEDLLDRRARRGAGVVLRELDADALRPVALDALRA